MAVDSKSKRTMTSNNPGWIAAWTGLLVIGSLVSLYLQRPDVPSPISQVQDQGVVEFTVDQRPDITEAISVFAEKEIPPPVETAYFEAILFQGDYADKLTAIRELRRLGSTEAIQTLSVALGDADERVRRAAMEALSSVSGDDAAAAIGSLSADIDPRVRADATLSLAMVGGDSATEYVKLALRDPDPIVRIAAINSLSDMGDDYSVSVIQQALQDPDEAVRERAIEVIDEMNDDAAFRALYPFSD